MLQHSTVVFQGWVCQNKANSNQSRTQKEDSYIRAPSTSKKVVGAGGTR